MVVGGILKVSAMAVNNAGLEVSGSANPNWKGGPIHKKCEVCNKSYHVKQAHAKSRYCSLQCVGISQRGINSRKAASKRVMLECEVCTTPFFVYKCQTTRLRCCSMTCSLKRRAVMMKGKENPNWNGGLSRFPYPYNFREISKEIIERDGGVCQNPGCEGKDSRLTTHHINYNKQDCSHQNLIALCSACNSKANFGRNVWTDFYQNLLKAKKNGGGWDIKEVSA